MKSGLGTFISADGSVQQGKWQNNIYIGDKWFFICKKLSPKSKLETLNLCIFLGEKMSR